MYDASMCFMWLLSCLQALYKFLDVMSVFDWEQHCVSMTGRVLLASFPNYQGAHSDQQLACSAVLFVECQHRGPVSP